MFRNQFHNGGHLAGGPLVYCLGGGNRQLGIKLLSTEFPQQISATGLGAIENQAYNVGIGPGLRLTAD